MATLIWWSIGPLFIKALTYCLDSFMQNALRYSLACLVMAPGQIVAMAMGRFDHSIWRKAIVPTIANVLMQTLWAACFYHAQPGLITMLSKTSVLWVAGLSLVLFAQERALATRKSFWAGLALSVTGVFGVVYFKPGRSTAGTGFGVFLVLLEAFFSGLYTISIKRYLGSVASQTAFFVVSIYTTAILWSTAAIFGDPGQALRLSPLQWSYVAVSAVLAIALGHTLYYAAIKRIGPTIPAMVILVQPFAVLMLSSIVFGERMTLLQICFGIILLAGAGMGIWSRRDLQVG